MKKIAAIDFMFAAFVGVYLMLQYMQFKYGVWLSDEGLLWYASKMISNGDMPIRDFFSYDPLRYYWIKLVLSLAGTKSLMSILIAGAIFSVPALVLLYLVLKDADVPMPSIFLVMILLALAFSYPRHKIYEQAAPLYLLSGLYWVSESTSKRKYFCFGILIGASACLGKNHGAYFLVAFLMLLAAKGLSGVRNGISLCMCYAFIGGFVGYLPVIFLVAVDAEFSYRYIESVHQLIGWQISLPIPFPWRIECSSGVIDCVVKISVGFLYLLIPLVYVLSCWFGKLGLRGVGLNENKLSRALFSTSVAGLVYLHHAFDRADFSHLAQGVLPVIPTMVLMLRHELGHTAKMRTLVGAVVIMTVVSWTYVLPINRLNCDKNDRSSSYMSVEGRVYCVDPWVKKILVDASEVKEKYDLKGNSLFVAPYYPAVYAYLNMKAPTWELYYLWPRSEAFQNELIDSLSSVSTVIWTPDATIDGRADLQFRVLYRQLHDYINRNYEKCAVESDIFELRRKGGC